MSGRSNVRPRDNPEGLRYAAARYSNCTIAKVLGVSETAVRKWLISFGIKRARSPDNISLAPEHGDDIREHLLFGEVQKKPKDYLFTDARGRLPSPDHVEKVFQALAKRCGLKRIRLHDLRHSFGSIWAERVRPTVLKEIMGHAAITTTERYIHATDEILRRSMEHTAQD